MQKMQEIQNIKNTINLEIMQKNEENGKTS